jgi:hypothetical protein
MFEFLPTKERVSLGFMIRQAVTTSLAGVLAAAIVHARPSILVSIRRVFNQEPELTIETLSAWGDLDFEQIQYDYAHLGLGTHGKRRWSMNLHPQVGFHSTRFTIIPIGAVVFYVSVGFPKICFASMPFQVMRCTFGIQASS